MITSIVDFFKLKGEVYENNFVRKQGEQIKHAKIKIGSDRYQTNTEVM